MKKGLLIALAIAGFMHIHARQLTPDEALARALDIDASSIVTPSRNTGLTLSYTSKDPLTGFNGVYVFNREDNGGFLVVSAEDSAEALLGYTDKGTFDPSDMPPALKIWLSEYTSQVVWASTHTSAEIEPSRNASVRPDRQAIAPLCTTRWNQDAPYYNMCPTFQGNRCVTGCTATAMAQVMKYHEWPDKGIGSYSYTTSSLKIPVSCNFGTTVFDWDNMLDQYTSSATSSQNDAVATLMFAAGVSIDMDYSPNASGAYTRLVGSSLIDYFGYDKAISYQKRNWYGLYDWESLIYDNLKSYGPVLLSGYTSTDAGHSFVCDGYSSDGYFHINWGWGGISDGYFLLTALDPDSQGIGGSTDGYNYNQEAIIGIRPATSSSAQYTPIIESVHDLNGTAKGKSVTVNGGFYNYSYTALSNVTYGVDIDGQFYESSNVRDKTLNYNYGYASYAVPLSNLPAGTYQLRPAFKIGDNDYELMKASINSVNYLNVTVSASGEITVSQPADVLGLSINDIRLLSRLIPGNAYGITAVAHNNGSKEFIGTISVVLKPASGSNNGTSIITYPLDAVVGEDTDIAVNGTLPSDIQPGDYSLYFAYILGMDYTQLSTPIDVTVEESSPAELSIDEFSVSNSTLDNVTINLTISNTGGYFYGSLTAYIYPYIPGQATSSVGSIILPNVEILPGTSRTVSLSGTFPQGEIGKTYFVYIFRDNSTTHIPNERGIYLTIDTTSGIDNLEADSATVSIEVYNISGIRIPIDAGITDATSLSASGNLPSGVYILVTTDSCGNRSAVKYIQK